MVSDPGGRRPLLGDAYLAMPSISLETTEWHWIIRSLGYLASQDGGLSAREKLVLDSMVEQAQDTYAALPPVDDAIAGAVADSIEHAISAADFGVKHSGMSARTVAQLAACKLRLFAALRILSEP